MLNLGLSDVPCSLESLRGVILPGLVTSSVSDVLLVFSSSLSFTSDSDSITEEISAGLFVTSELCLALCTLESCAIVCRCIIFSSLE